MSEKMKGGVIERKVILLMNFEVRNSGISEGERTQLIHHTLMKEES